MMKKKKVALVGAIIVVMSVVAASGLSYFGAIPPETNNRLAVIEDEKGDRIGVEPLSDEVWSKLVELFHSREMMWIGGVVEEFINIKLDKYYKWGFRFKPGTIVVAEVTAEGLQTTIRSISADIGYWLDIGQAYVFAKVVDYSTGINMQAGGIEGTVTDYDGTPLAGMRVGIVSGTTFFPEIAAETNEEGYYQIGSVPPGTFEVAVHDIQGNRIGLESVTVRGGETSTLNFVIQSAPSDVTKFTAVVNGMRNVNVFVHVDISNGLTKEEAERIAEATFIEVMGERVMHRLDTLTFDDTQIKAHYTWGVDENDMGHVFGMTADLTTLQIAVSHCR